MTNEHINLCFILLVIVYNVASNSTDVFTIFTEGCTIPKYPIMSDRIRNLVMPPKNTLVCSGHNSLVASNTTHIWVIKEAFPFFNVWEESEFYCCYRYFSPKNLTTAVYGNCNEFSSIISVKHEFVRSECYYLDDKIYEDFFVYPSMKKKSYSSYNRESYNVLILGVEGMSRNNFHRTMPWTTKFLLNKGFHQLLGYNKVGDNSFPNLFPVFTGLSFKYIETSCTKKSSYDTVGCKLLWDNFKEAGFYTALGSDTTAGLLGTYEYSFQNIPTHFYLQPLFTQARSLYKKKNYDYHQCVGSKISYKIMLNYIYEISVKLEFNRLFGIFWEQSISHQEDLNYPHIMDEDYYVLLNKLEKDGYLNKTILIFLSDHGMRWGNILLTEEGRLEERLPILGILFPDEFKLKYKLAYKNFQENANALITPFDIYKTFLDLVHLKSIADHNIRKRSMFHNTTNSASSLFLPVSGKRTCKTLGIDEHWCTCYKGEKLIPTSQARIKAAHHLIRHINDFLRPFSQCHQLKLIRVIDCSVVKNYEKERTYTVVIKSDPGGAIFDGTLLQHRSTWAISGVVSRLNLYLNQSYCVDNNFIKMYCFCR